MTTTSSPTDRPATPVADSPLLLTDDEVVAVALDRGTFWPGGLPTVAADDPADLAAASNRGHRSLLVRGLLGDTGRITPGGSLAVATEVAGAAAHVSVFLADDDYRRASWGMASSHFPTATGWVLETITPTGVHHLTVHDADEHRRYLEAVLDSASRLGPAPAPAGEARDGADAPGGFPGEDGAVRRTATSVCILAVAPAGALLARARRGEVGLARVDLAEGRIAGAEVVASVPATAVACLMRTAGPPGEPAP